MPRILQLSGHPARSETTAFTIRGGSSMYHPAMGIPPRGQEYASESTTFSTRGGDPPACTIICLRMHYIRHTR